MLNIKVSESQCVKMPGMPGVGCVEYWGEEHRCEQNNT